MKEVCEAELANGASIASKLHVHYILTFVNNPKFPRATVKYISIKLTGGIFLCHNVYIFKCNRKSLFLELSRFQK